MKDLLLVFALLVAAVMQGVTAGELSETDPRYGEIRELTVLPYYGAMQKGEVTLLKKYLSSRRYAANRALIEQNTEYPDHLRKHFNGAGFELLSVTEDEQNERMTAVVRVYWPEGRETQAALVLIEDSSGTSDIRWKIDRD